MPERPVAPPSGVGEGKLALVTGANTGIGLALVRSLSGLGFDVLLGARDRGRGTDAVAALADEGVSARLVLLDLADRSSIASAAAEIAERHGRLDVLINNAGVKAEFFPETATPSAASLDVLAETLMVNVVGTTAVIQAMLPLLRRSEAARIVNLSSGLGSMTWATEPSLGYQRVSLLGYCTSKAALNMVTVQFANELRSSGIKVNAADPGSVATPMNPRATRTPDEAVLPMVWLATLGPEGPTGSFFDADGLVPW